MQSYIDTIVARYPWFNNWKEYKYPLINPSFKDEGYGSDSGMANIVWLASLCNGIGSFFKEGMTILDYGCGSARLGNFISGFLKDFIYYGIEPKDSKGYDHQKRDRDIGWGQWSIQKARETIGHDPRINLGFIGESIEQEAIKASNVVVLGSVFTHLKMESLKSITNKLLPIIDREGAIIITLFFDDTYHTYPEQADVYGRTDCWKMVFYTRDQISNFTKSLNLKLLESCSIYAQGRPINQTHYIMRLER